MRDLRRHRSLTTAAAVLAAAAVMSAAPAAAVQTSTYKLAATGPRTKLVHGYGAGAVHDTFVVANLTGTPLTLVLQVVSATLQSNGDYALGQPGQQFAGKVRIPANLVTLKAHEQRTMPVVIDRPGHTSQPLFAAITAQPQSAPSGGIGVPLRLALLVEVTATPERVSGTSTATSVERIVAVIVAAGLAVGLVFLLLRRRRRREDEAVA
jgi:hypothetical protein